MPFELVIAQGEGRGRRFRFDAREVTIGRAAENDLVVHDPRASRGHARIRARGDGYALLDDGSCNGTQVNERPASGATRLRDGDRIRVGTTVLEFALPHELAAMAHTRNILSAAAAAARRWPLRIRVAAGAAALVALVVVGLVAGRAMTPRRATATPARIEPFEAPSRGAAPSIPDVPSAAELFRDTGGELRAVREAYERGRRKLEERRIAPRNLYEAWRSFTAAANALESVGAESIVRGSLSPSLAGLVRWTERELEAECKRLLFAAARFERYGQEAQVQTAYRDLLLHFPGDEPSGCRRKTQEALASIETAAPAVGVFGYPEDR
jgi:hypothetical protein